MVYFILIGLFITILAIWRDPKIMRVDFKSINTFITIMILFAMFRLVLFSLSNDIFQLDVVSLNQGVDQIKFWRLALVFWEDAFFAIPIYYMKDKWKWSKYIWIPIVIALSIQFGLGHIYQHPYAFFAALPVPYLLFYIFGKKYGFGTTMICHILFDMFTILTFKIAPLVV